MVREAVLAISVEVVSPRAPGTLPNPGRGAPPPPPRGAGGRARIQT